MFVICNNNSPKYVNSKPQSTWMGSTLPAKIWKNIPIVPTSFSTNTFLLTHQAEVIPLLCGVLFELQLSPGEVSKSHLDVCYLEFSLYFTNDLESKDLIKVQTRTVRLNHIISNTFSGLVYHPIEFDGVYAAMCDVLISHAIVSMNPTLKTKEKQEAVVPSPEKSSWFPFTLLPSPTQVAEDESSLSSADQENEADFASENQMHADLLKIIQVIVRLSRHLPHSAADAWFNTVKGALPFAAGIHNLQPTTKATITIEASKLHDRELYARIIMIVKASEVNRL
jgi:hypothetical protein